MKTTIVDDQQSLTLANAIIELIDTGKAGGAKKACTILGINREWHYTKRMPAYLKDAVQAARIKQKQQRQDNRDTETHRVCPSCSQTKAINAFMSIAPTKTKPAYRERQCQTCATTLKYKRARERRAKRIKEGDTKECTTCNKTRSLRHFKQIGDKHCHSCLSKKEWASKTEDWHNSRIEYAQEHRKRTRDSLDDTYVKRLIYRETRLKADEIPESIINLKRKQLCLQKKLKELHTSSHKV